MAGKSKPSEDFWRRGRFACFCAYIDRLDVYKRQDPHRLIPLDVMRDLEAEGKIKSVFDYFYTTCGVGTNVETSKEMGRKLAEDLKKSGVSAAIFTST